jgi:hypothetical protein
MLQTFPAFTRDAIRAVIEMSSIGAGEARPFKISDRTLFGISVA